MNTLWAAAWIEPKLIKSYRIPDGNVDFARGTTAFTFSLWSRDKFTNGPAGTLRLKYTQSNNGMIDMAVEWRGRRYDNEQVQEARVVCRKDELLSPVGWNLKNYCTQKHTVKLPYTEMSETAKVSPDRIEIGSSGRLAPRTVPFNGKLTSNWSLMYAVPQMRHNQCAAPEFDLFENLCFLRSGLRLSPAGTYDFSLGTQTVPLHGFVMLGTGIQPTWFWIDDGGRPLFVTTSPVFTFYLTGMEQEVPS